MKKILILISSLFLLAGCGAKTSAVTADGTKLSASNGGVVTTDDYILDSTGTKTYEAMVEAAIKLLDEAEAAVD